MKKMLNTRELREDIRHRNQLNDIRITRINKARIPLLNLSDTD